MITTVKRWMLALPNFTEADYKWCKKYSHDLQVKTPTSDFEIYGKRYAYASGFPEIIIQTTTQEQEDMLQLKYSGSLYLLNVIAMTENTYYQDEYGPITLNRS